MTLLPNENLIAMHRKLFHIHMNKADFYEELAEIHRSLANGHEEIAAKVEDERHERRKG